MARLKLAIMGGTFNPIHVGHLVCAEEAVGQFGLDKVLFMPTGKSPHKETENAVDAEDRFQMVVRATAGNPHFEVSRHELDNDQTSYTVDTLRYFRAELPDTELFFITGTDAVIEILEWKEPEEIFQLATLIAATRFGYPLEKIPAKERKFLEVNGARFMEIPCIGVSSSLVRERASRGQSIRYLVPEGVEKYIEKERLYLQK